MTPEMLRDGTPVGLTLSGDAQIGFFFTDFKDVCDPSGNIDFDDLDTSFNVTQERIDADTSKIYNFIPNPSYDLKSSILDASLEYSTMLPTTSAYYKEGRHYETKKVDTSTSERTCLHALRLTNPNMDSFGYATITEKQCILYGFETTFTMNIAHANLK